MLLALFYANMTGSLHSATTKIIISLTQNIFSYKELKIASISTCFQCTKPSNTKGSKVSFELKRCFARRLAKAIGSRGPPFWRKSVERRSVSKRPIVELELKSRSNRAREGVTTGLSPSKKPLKQLAYYITAVTRKGHFENAYY